jgi:hypothetical protein
MGEWNRSEHSEVLFMNDKQKWYESTKKTLGVVGFILNFILQGFAVWQDSSLITILAPANTALVLGLLGLKKMSNKAIEV